MLCASLIGPALKDLKRQLILAKDADLLEFRIDLLHSYTLEGLYSLKCSTDKPLIFTFKNASLEEILALAPLPNYLDLEWNIPSDWLKILLKKNPSLQLILSYHNFEKTEKDLEALLQKLRCHKASFYKIACMANSSSDALAMLELQKNHKDLIAVSMGEKGSFTRILAPLYGAPWVYAPLSLKEKTAEGQIPLKDLLPYKKSSFYGLIGHVEKSPSHITHNALFQKIGLNSFYVKIPLEKEELSSFFATCSPHGLSVTMPLKEAVLPYLDEIDKEALAIGAVNTIVFQNGKKIGFNTDGKGALDALEEKTPVSQKKILILGAGGAAKAIIYEALKRGAKVFVHNRTEKKAKELAAKWGVTSVDAIPDYDILINATPNPMPLAEEKLLFKKIVMETSIAPTPLLLAAKKRGCKLVYGKDMFLYQAVGQFALWFPHIERTEIFFQLKRLLTFQV